MVKVEAEDPVPDFDSLVSRLDKLPLSSWDVPASPEQYIKEIQLGDYIGAMLVDLALAAGAATESVVKPTSTAKPSKISQVPAVDRGKGPFIPYLKKKKAPPSKPKGNVIGTSVISEPLMTARVANPGRCEYDFLKLSPLKSNYLINGDDCFT